MAMVGNPMMLSMADFVGAYLATSSYRLHLPESERASLVEGFDRVASMMRSIITYGYDHAMSSALYERAGMPEVLLARLGDQTVREALSDAKTELGL
jgi:hypothetical protein